MGHWKYVIWFLNIWGYPRDVFAIDSNFIQLWSKKIFYRSWVLFNLLRLVLWHRMWTILVDVLCESEKNVHSAIVGWSINVSWLIVLLKSYISLLIFYLFSYWEGFWKSPTVIVGCLIFFWLHHAACRILIPWPGIEPHPLQWKHGVLITGLPGNSDSSSRSFTFCNLELCYRSTSSHVLWISWHFYHYEMILYI